MSYEAGAPATVLERFLELGPFKCAFNFSRTERLDDTYHMAKARVARPSYYVTERCSATATSIISLIRPGRFVMLMRTAWRAIFTAIGYNSYRKRRAFERR